jgi:5-methylcytosine-specific restriction endonuclease McrA
MPPRYRREAWLREQYHGEGRTQQEMADACDVSPRTIREWMNRHGIETRDMKGENHPLYGTERDESVKEQISETMDGREISEETRAKIAAGHRGRTLDAETRVKISDALTGITRSPETRQRMSESTAGERNPNWKGGYSHRYGPGWAIARKRALERDEVCQQCGHDGTEDRLEVHHIIPVRRFREASNATIAEAHDLKNLVTLCKRCHPRADHGKLDFESGIEPPE